MSIEFLGKKSNDFLNKRTQVMFLYTKLPIFAIACKQTTKPASKLFILTVKNANKLQSDMREKMRIICLSDFHVMMLKNCYRFQSQSFV